MPRAARPFANSVNPVLSETESSASWTVPIGSDELVLDELGAQRGAIHAEDIGGLRLVALGTRHDRRQQRALDVADDHVVDAGGCLAIEALEIFVERAIDAAADFVAAVQPGFPVAHAARASLAHAVSSAMLSL